VINVSWNDAKLYVAWLARMTGKKYRLLSETEWEYAAYPAEDPPFDETGLGDIMAQFMWYAKNSGDKTQPVGRKPANAFGLYDMLGNVWDWVEDCYLYSYMETPTDGSAWTNNGCNIRVVRGYSWNDQPGGKGSRYSLAADSRVNDLRVARTLTP
jgi:formylglycine-generating enzyme required for sulfatase activity